ncbi:hypothetical protein ET475_15310 [Microbacterium protaetiae]|uniref:Uncharacterized protein n=1 Tax=Microbacterium protaetiae TaxID=2509458 RepID=A0A4P6EFQ3_9MICO|nr:hypothetical protein [Microbacterium protaetiae]QAY61212.1 hypothetical protein ET475_15310 [Microbacterium protaetiae]
MGIIVGLIITIGGAALTFPSRTGDAFIMDVDLAAPWAGILTPIGALIMLISCWWVPSRYIGGPAITIIVGGFTIVAIVLIIVRTNWDDVPPDTVPGLFGLVLAAVVLSVSGVRAWRRRVRRQA